MDLKSGYPFWAIKNGLMQPFPAWHGDGRCDVVVVGAGITGALIADELTHHGHDVIVLDQRDVGWGSTAASTALLQYEIDTHMVDLARRYGEADAVLAYRACATAVVDLQRIAGEIRDVGLQRNHSLYYASDRRHRGALKAEYLLRHTYGFDVEWLDRKPLRERFAVDRACAILSTLGACVDPYRLAHRVLARVRRGGGGVFDRSTVERIEPTARGVEVHVANGRVRAKHVVLAAGYANERWLSPRIARNRSSYAFVTDPIDSELLGPLATTMLWESARPYLYMRTTSDMRLLVGGEDDAVDNPVRRDARVDSKAQRLMKRVAQLFPRLPLTPTFAWAGTFAETKDGLPYFGPHASCHPRLHFAMAYGGNGITYSMIGAGILRALIERRPHPLAALFSFQRLER